MALFMAYQYPSLFPVLFLQSLYFFLKAFTSTNVGVFPDILQQILKEVKSSNKVLNEKVSQLEKTVSELHNSTMSRKKIKLSPSRAERVSTATYM